VEHARNERMGPAALASLAAALLAALAGCSGGPAEQAPMARVGVLVPSSERPLWLALADSFETAHPGVRIDVVEGPQATDLRENLYTASLLAKDPSFDLVYMDVTWTSKFAAAGFLEPLDSWFPEEERSRFLPEALAAGRVGGRLYRIPVRTDVGLLYFREDWLRAAGRAPPETFRDLLSTAEALQDPPMRWGFVWQGKQYEGLVCDFLEVLHGSGGYWIDPATGEVGLDRPESIAALAFLSGCVRRAHVTPPGVTTYQEEESRRLFQDGRAVFLRNWPYVWRLAQSEDSPIRGRIGAGPMVHRRGFPPAATLGGWGLGVSRYSRNPEGAVAFIRFVASMAGQRILCLSSGYAPSRAEAYRDSDFLAQNPFLEEIARVHRFAVPRPRIARYALASDLLQRHLSAALAGTETPATALRRAARETRALLRASGFLPEAGR
jgi:multiple sugar transport system substrate-binding protein